MPERRAALEEIDPWWCPAWPITWQRVYATARQWWLEADGRVDWAQLPTDVVFEGEQLGRWVQAQRAGWPGLEEDQQDLLAALGIEEDQELAAARAAAAAKPKVSRADRFQQGLAALAAFVEREGHARVPRPHREALEVVVAGTGGEDSVEVVFVGLGAFLNNTKARRAKLTTGQLAQLAEHGVEWAQRAAPLPGAVSLGGATLLRPREGVGGRHPVVAASSRCWRRARRRPSSFRRWSLCSRPLPGRAGRPGSPPAERRRPARRGRARCPMRCFRTGLLCCPLGQARGTELLLRLVVHRLAQLAVGGPAGAAGVAAYGSGRHVQEGHEQADRQLGGLVRAEPVVHAQRAVGVLLQQCQEPCLDGAQLCHRAVAPATGGVGLAGRCGLLRGRRHGATLAGVGCGQLR
ncbi:helicase associated domain-containing protein [Kitasatospora sp. NPDC004669]|uniref:helicase associated domain-containing protein n=1 Tax=Kitasatospora sp. NPDC004669 TaxID=3154555 RepID=UPI0033A7901C